MMKILKSYEIFELKFYIFFLIFKFSNFLKLLNFKFFWENFDPPTDGISTPLLMVYRPPYLWYFDPPTHGILTPYPWYIDPPTHGILTPPTHGILTPLPMVYRPPYPWYIEPLTHGISTSLSMVF